ncbi:rhomboid family-domain-containing protein [Fimicolochytrium jonesii]|uniref:rhomboid family-domain-containing protein n=1 Tax=Fimicolochytrium jonesii TaxID=1396493 RepID=UPI0022FE1311|nr:rhomboid family-domain-containing protein [Fimicolochytrium jonesii]KAI8820090.1 rhomboid family-domain-containing protein [Fimicolochytrium jonesii]
MQHHPTPPPYAYSSPLPGSWPAHSRTADGEYVQSFPNVTNQHQQQQPYSPQQHNNERFYHLPPPPQHARYGSQPPPVSKSLGYGDYPPPPASSYSAGSPGRSEQRRVWPERMGGQRLPLPSAPPEAVMTDGRGRYQDTHYQDNGYAFYADPRTATNILNETSDGSGRSSRQGSGMYTTLYRVRGTSILVTKNYCSADIETGDSPHSSTESLNPRRGSSSSYYSHLAAEQAASQKGPRALQDPLVRAQLLNQKRHSPYFLILITTAQIAAFLGELYMSWKRTGSPIQTSPDFNYMIGPGPGTLISMGARFVPCMRTGTGYESSDALQCPVGTKGSLAGGTLCTLNDICGMSGLADPKHPNQWYRFITPIGLHGGVVHLLLNLSFQIRTGFAMERDFGWWRMLIIYMSSGIAGFIFGANFNPLTPSVGCSGSLYGLLACLLLDLFYNWQLITRPIRELFFLFIQIAISLLIGMLPYIDNFAHMGGFYTGLLAGLVFMPTIYFSEGDKWRKRMLAVLALPGLGLVMYFLLRGFYRAGDQGADTTGGCAWCKYLNCIPGMPWCDQKWDVATTAGGNATSAAS